MKYAILFSLVLPGCTYRYDLGRFEANSVPNSDPEPPRVVSQEQPCEDDVQTTSLQVTTKLDEANQTVTTNAISETHKVPVKPCK